MNNKIKRMEGALKRKVRDFEELKESAPALHLSSIAYEIYILAEKLGKPIEEYKKYKQFIKFWPNKVSKNNEKTLQHDMTPLDVLEAREQMWNDLINY
jgi:hypothetical protein